MVIRDLILQTELLPTADEGHHVFTIEHQCARLARQWALGCKHLGEIEGHVGTDTGCLG
jgi:hypothetical protein